MYQNKILYTTEEYIHGFQEIFSTLAPSQRLMLQVQSVAPKHTMTPFQMAQAVGWKNHSPANLHYGKMGQKLHEAIPQKPRGMANPAGWHVLSTGQQGLQGFKWTMRAEVLEALETLRLVDTKKQQDINEDIADESTFAEGAAYSKKTKIYERSRTAREACIAHFGAKCFVCDLDFSRIYGDELQGYIHVHHLKPLSEIGKKYVVDPVKDLIPVCPNCHAVIHSRCPPYSPEAVRQMLSKGKYYE